MLVIVLVRNLEFRTKERQNKKIVIVLVTILELFSLLCNLNSALMETEQDWLTDWMVIWRCLKMLRHLGTAFSCHTLDSFSDRATYSAPISPLFQVSEMFPNISAINNVSLEDHLDISARLGWASKGGWPPETMLEHLVVHHPSYLTLTTRLGDKNPTPARRPIDLYLPGRGKYQSSRDILTHSFTSAFWQIFLASVKLSGETSRQWTVYCGINITDTVV